MVLERDEFCILVGLDGVWDSGGVGWAGMGDGSCRWNRNANGIWYT